MDRRQLLRAALGGSVNLGIYPSLLKGRELSLAEKRNRIAVSSWSLHGFFASTRPEDYKWPGTMIELLHFPEIIADQYHIHNFEFESHHFESTVPSYLSDLKKRLMKVRGNLINIPVDMTSDFGGLGLCDPNDSQWHNEIAERKRWIDIGATLGARSIRVGPGGTPQTTDFTRPGTALRQLASYGKTKGVKVLIENHGKNTVGYQAAHVAAIVKAVGPECAGWAGSCPDIGNFNNNAERYRGLEILLPLALTVCHAKGISFDAHSNETDFDFPRCIKIAENSGYHGVYSIEVAGRCEPYSGIQNVINELLRFLS